MVDNSELPTVAPRSPPSGEPSTIDLVPAAPLHDQPTLTPPSRSAPPSADLAEQPTLAPPSDFAARDSCPVLSGDWTLEAKPFGEYELLGEIARGGMGIVYRARERHSGRLVALKMMLANSSGDSIDRNRFILEARATGELSHPGIVTIHSWGEMDGHSYYTMDFVPGYPLNQVLKRRRLTIDQSVRYMIAIARAVGAAHGQGIVHRDLKPSNVMVDSTDRPRVLDFGLAKRVRQVAEAPHVEEEVVDVLPADAVVPELSPIKRISGDTARGTVLGTPAYMAPEQARGEHDRVGPEADVHALGAIFFEMLTGRPPFQAPTIMDTLIQVMEQEAPSPRGSNPQVAKTLDELCRRCLQKDPARRYADANALADDLERRWQRNTQSRRFLRLALISGLAGLVILLAQYFTGWAGLSGSTLAARLQVLFGSQEKALEGAASILSIVFGAMFTLIPALSLLAALVWLCAWMYTLLRLAGSGLGTAAKAPEAEPYLQKLFVGRRQSSGRPGKEGADSQETVLADVESGKPVQDTARCLVYRGRQKSLDRPILVWQDRAALLPDAPAPGVVVHHPAVLALHAVDTCAEGRVLVTAAAAALPVADLLDRQRFEPLEAASIVARLAHAIQAFHNQGVCHGRLNPDWILLQSDCEPLLCPCGIPSQKAADRSQDVVDLGRLLREWLPPRPRGWARRALAPLHMVCDGALCGEYDRAAELGRDIGRAARLAVVRWRERLAKLVILSVFALSLLAYLLFVYLGTALGSEVRLQPLLLALGLCAGALGFVHGRDFVQYHRLSLIRTVRRRYLRGRILAALVQVGVIVLLPAALILADQRHESGWVLFLGVCSELLACWFLGICTAGMFLLLEILDGTLRLGGLEKTSTLDSPYGEPADSSPSWRTPPSTLPPTGS
jgi:serine/threonine protein kinase